jgi:hypothetical protein
VTSALVCAVMSVASSPIRRLPRFALRALAFGLAMTCISAFGQALPASVPDDAWMDAPLDPGTRVLPVWSNVSGRVEALLLLDPSIDSPASSPLDRLLSPERSTAGFGLRVHAEGGSMLHGSLRVEPDAGLALLCDGTVGASGALASLTDQCLLATLDAEDPMLRDMAQGAELRLGWRSPDEFLDLSFGLSWLQRDAAPSPLPMLVASGVSDLEGAEGMNALGFWTSQLDVQSLRMDGLINLGPQARMLIGGNVGRSRLLGAAGGAPISWESSALSVGLGYRAFSGLVTGRLIELPGRGNRWAGLDVGLSWRTPWRGELSIGARNVLGDGDNTRWPLAELPALEEPAARVPYVRYHQDL